MTAPRARAGQPYMMDLHRATPIDFVLSDDEEQEVRNGYDQAMKAEIKRPEVEANEGEDFGPPEMVALAIVLTVVVVLGGLWIAGWLL